jgi:hypothetical protein
MGLLCGLIVALAFLGVSASLIDGGSSLAGTVLGTVDIIGLVSVFVFSGRRSN